MNMSDFINSVLVIQTTCNLKYLDLIVIAHTEADETFIGM